MAVWNTFSTIYTTEDGVKVHMEITVPSEISKDESRLIAEVEAGADKLIEKVQTFHHHLRGALKR